MESRSERFASSRPLCTWHQSPDLEVLIICGPFLDCNNDKVGDAAGDRLGECLGLETCQFIMALFLNQSSSDPWNMISDNKDDMYNAVPTNWSLGKGEASPKQCMQLWLPGVQYRFPSNKQLDSVGSPHWPFSKTRQVSSGEVHLQHREDETSMCEGLSFLSVQYYRARKIKHFAIEMWGF